jgi:hypothetical protein
MGLKKPEEVFENIQKSREFWEKIGPVTEYSLESVDKYKKMYKNRPLVFPFEYAMSCFVEYFKDHPVWYAHNGNRFDYPIMEKWFRIADLPYRCVPFPNAPGKKTTAMKTVRDGPNFRMKTWKGDQIGFVKWDILPSDRTIRCHDTMWMFKQHPDSKYVRNGHGARRVSQGRELGFTQRTGKAKKILWSDGSVTKDIYGFKLQDILNDVGIRPNDPTAHTALADCVTLREALYRGFSMRTDEKKLVCALEGETNVREARRNAIKTRLGELLPVT